LTEKSARIHIFSGRFGSGKTEIAINYAVWLTRLGAFPLLVDLDVVTPYFRTRDRAARISALGVELVGPYRAGQLLDTPALSPRIRGAIEQGARPVVVDLGGDPQGARAIAQFAGLIADRPHVMYFCVNPYRPFTGDAAGIEAGVRQVEASSRLCVSALVSNPHLMGETTPDVFSQGERVVWSASQRLDLPVAFAVISEALSVQVGLRRPSLSDPNPGWAQFERLPVESVDRQEIDVLVIHRFFLMLDETGG